MHRHNILLDETFVAKVADFGFVTPLPEDIGSTAVVTAEGVVGLAGTQGYLPPEHCDGKRGVKSDVYRYGIVSCYSCTEDYYYDCYWCIGLP